MYDYATTWSWAWPYLRGKVPVPTTLVPTYDRRTDDVDHVDDRCDHEPVHDRGRPDEHDRRRADARPQRPPRPGGEAEAARRGMCQSNLSAE